MGVPTWVQDAVFYQIFPDRFDNGNPALKPPNVKPWGSHPTSESFQGGDLQGIINHLDYLKDLGINAIYLNPIFLSPSTHRYNTTDYFRIDPKLGSMIDFQNLIKAAHHKHIRVILDGVFNHSGRGFFAFSDILENQAHSAYRDWFFIRKFPIDAFSSGEAVDYLGWWKHKSLPKLNTNNPLVRQYIMDVARFWLDEGMDGWRLDVPNEIDDDGFWAEFRKVVKKANPDAYLLGEIWTVDPRWVGDSHFDGLMNYPYKNAIIDVIKGKIRPLDFSSQIENVYRAYPAENSHSMYNLLGSHDTERIFTMLDQNTSHLKQAIFTQFTLPGAPAIYYGDEIGLTGGRDPDCRKAFIWDSSTWNGEIHDWIKKLVKLRHSSLALRRGKFKMIPVNENSKIAGYFRELHVEKEIALMNFSEETSRITIQVEDGERKDKAYKDLLTGKVIHPEGNTLHLTLHPNGQMLLKEIENHRK